MRYYAHMVLPIDILSLTAEQFALEARLRIPQTAGFANQIYKQVFSVGILDAEAFGASKKHALVWNDLYTIGLLRLDSKIEEQGAVGLTSKLIFRTHDNLSIETVSIPMFGGTHTLCVSSQIGCSRACAFCETGTMGLVRNLNAAEIVSQVLSARLILGHNFRNIVFMGMGEPLDNLISVEQALKVLTDRRAFAYSMERLTICTSGDAEDIQNLAQLGHKRLNLSISLNAARDELRSQLMPINRSTPLSSLMAALKSYPKRKNFVLGVNYCLMPGLNDSEEDAHAIASFCQEVGRALVNLIPYNPGRTPLTRAPNDTDIERFLSLLSSEKVPVRLRIEKGRSVMAACGQLGGCKDNAEVS
ncbi:hypothetical protein MASR2M78_00020 [Treponema sp.]